MRGCREGLRASEWDASARAGKPEQPIVPVTFLPCMLGIPGTACDHEQQQPEGAMWLIIVYVIFMIIGDILDYFIGTMVDRIWPAASLPVFLLLYFLFLWLAWVIAVRVTEPKAAHQA